MAQKERLDLKDLEVKMEKREWMDTQEKWDLLDQKVQKVIPEKMANLDLMEM